MKLFTQRDMLRALCVRVFLLSILIFAPVRTWAVGWTPTDAGLAVNFQPGDQFLLSVMVDDDNDPETPEKEYFVCHYPSYTGGRFKYKAAHCCQIPNIFPTQKFAHFTKKHYLCTVKSKIISL